MVEVASLVVRRFFSALVVLFLIVSLIFFMMRTVGDPAALQLGEDATAESLAAFRALHGLDLPVWQQWINYIGDVLRGDFGQSFRYRESAMTVVLSRLPATLILGGLATLATNLIAIPIGMYAALRPGSWIDAGSRIFAVAGQSMPIFWFGILLILYFSVRHSMLPAVGAGTWRHLVLPTMALAIYSMPLTMRLARSSMLEVLNREYIKAARAKGITERRVNFNHAFRNASIPVITVIGMRIGHVISGTVVLEEVFAYPGMGRLAIQSIHHVDYPVIQAFVFVVAALVILVNLIVDIIYGLVDPRIRVSQ